MIPSQNSSKKIFIAFLFCLIFTAAIFVRIDQVFTFSSDYHQFFVDGQPSFIDLDGYYYLQNAKEFLEGRYSTIDSLRAYPDFATRTATPSLLSIVTAYISSLTGFTLPWVATALPVILGLLVIIPIYLFSSTFGSPLSAIFATAASVLALYYSSRTSLGRFDTDCLNVFLPLMIGYSFMRFGVNPAATRYAWLTLGLLSTIFFYFWWDMAHSAVLVLAVSPLIIALLFHYRAPKGEAALLYFVLLIVCFTCFLVIGKDQSLQILKSLFGQITYISKQSPGIFPDIASSIEEQQRYSFLDLSDYVSTGMVSFLLSLVGLVVLAYHKRSQSLYLLPLFTVGLFGIFWAERFLIFLSPILAIGIGYFFYSLFRSFKNNKLIIAISFIFLFFTIINSSFTPRLMHTFISGRIVKGMVEAKQLTAPGSVIWSWWDEGHPLIYWSDRATVDDGFVHGGLRTHCTALPLASDNFRYSANFMRFYVTRGTTGIKNYVTARGITFPEALKELETIFRLGQSRSNPYISNLSFKQIGVETTQAFTSDFFFPQAPTPLYLFIDSRMLSILRTIYWFGTWDTNTLKGHSALPTFRLPNSGFKNSNLPQHPDVFIDLTKGHVSIKEILPGLNNVNKIVSISEYSNILADFSFDPDYQNSIYSFSDSIDKKIANDQKLTNTGIYQLHLFPHKNEIVLIDTKYVDTLLYQLFVLKTKTQFFTPIDTSSPDYQIWKVEAEMPGN